MNIPILTYHRILPRGGTAAVDIDVFDAQLELLQRLDYKTIHSAELAECLAQNDDNRKTVAVTFDDGWLDNWTFATPILKKHNAKAVLAVSTGLVDLDNEKLRTVSETSLDNSKRLLASSAYHRDKSGFLNFREIRTMADSGMWDIQAHGDSHFGHYKNFRGVRGFHPKSTHWTLEHALGEPPFTGAPRAEFQSDLSSPLTRPSKEFINHLKSAKSDKERQSLCRNAVGEPIILEDAQSYKIRAVADMTRCARILEERAGIMPAALFWPWGHYTEESVAAAREAGFELLLTMDKDIAAHGASPLKIPRIAAPNSVDGLRRILRILASPWRRWIWRKLSRSAH